MYNHNFIHYNFSQNCYDIRYYFIKEEYWRYTKNSLLNRIYVTPVLWAINYHSSLLPVNLENKCTSLWNVVACHYRSKFCHYKGFILIFYSFNCASVIYLFLPYKLSFANITSVFLSIFSYLHHDYAFKAFL